MVCKTPLACRLELSDPGDSGSISNSSTSLLNACLLAILVAPFENRFSYVIPRAHHPAGVVKHTILCPILSFNEKYATVVLVKPWRFDDNFKLNHAANAFWENNSMMLSGAMANHSQLYQKYCLYYKDIEGNTHVCRVIRIKVPTLKTLEAFQLTPVFPSQRTRNHPHLLTISCNWPKI